MPPNAQSAAVTDGFRVQLSLVRENTADAVAGLLLEVDLDLRPLGIEQGMQRWMQRAESVLAGSTSQAARLAAAYLPAYVRAGGGEPSGVVMREVTDELPDLSVVRGALLWRLGRSEGRGAAMHTATGTARRIAREVVGGSATATLGLGIYDDPAVAGWSRVASATCCRRCGSLTGQLYPAESRMARPHPADRCTQEPVLAGISEALVRRAPTIVAA